MARPKKSSKIPIIGVQKINNFFATNRAVNPNTKPTKPIEKLTSSTSLTKTKSPDSAKKPKNILKPIKNLKNLKPAIQKLNKNVGKVVKKQIKATFQQPVLSSFFRKPAIASTPSCANLPISPQPGILGTQPQLQNVNDENLRPKLQFITLPNLKNKSKRSSTAGRKSIDFVFPEGDAGLPNLIVPNLDVLFVGINPGMHACIEKHHFAGPVNHFWQCLYQSNLTDRLHHSNDDVNLPELYKIGITNMVKTATKLASDITDKQWEEGAINLLKEVNKHKPKFIVFNGISTFRHFLNYAVIPEMKSKNPEIDVDVQSISSYHVNENDDPIVNESQKDKPQKINKSFINSKLKILPGLQDVKICNDQTQIFAIPSSSPLARLTMNEKLFYYKEIKNLVKRSNQPSVVENKVTEVGSQEDKNAQYCSDWMNFFGQFSASQSDIFCK